MGYVTKDQRGVHYIDTLIVENLYFPFVFPHPISTTTETKMENGLAEVVDKTVIMEVDAELSLCSCESDVVDETCSLDGDDGLVLFQVCHGVLTSACLYLSVCRCCPQDHMWRNRLTVMKICVKNSRLIRIFLHWNQKNRG